MKARKNYTVILEEEKPTVNISPIIYQKISKLCQKIHKVEWSGILFYDIIGDFDKMSELVFDIKDIYLMDIGSQAYTEYTLGEDVIGYIMSNQKIEDCYMGHIHSHNSMKTFFSGTDLEELYENSFNNKPYLSLIVNNVGEYCAKVAMNTSMSFEKKILQFRDCNGKTATKNIPKRKSNLIFVNDCNVVEKLEDFDTFNYRIIEIINLKNSKKPKSPLQPYTWINPVIKDYEKSNLDEETTKLIDNFTSTIEGSETKLKLAKRLLNEVYKLSIIIEISVGEILDSIEFEYHEYSSVITAIREKLLHPLDK